MSKTEIRERHSSDIPALAAALIAVHQEDGYPVEGVDNPTTWLSPGHLLGAWTATLDGQPVGHVALASPGPGDDAARILTELDGTTPDHIAVLGRLFILPSARGHALGLSLAEAATKKANQLHRRVVFDVMEKDRAAIRMYERAGAQLLGTFNHCYGDALREPARAYVALDARPPSTN